MTITWTNEDTNAAHAQGWGIFYTSGLDWEGNQIERLDETEVFPSDHAAIVFVTHNAEAGCRLARKAIAYIKQEGGRIYR
jgi:hypothetical protein